MNKKILIVILITVSSLCAVSGLLSIWMHPDKSFKLTFGLFMIIFLPGYVWSWVIWNVQEIDLLERLIFSIVFSLGILPLALFSLNQLGIKINILNAIFEAIGIIVIGIFTLKFLRPLLKHLKH